MKKIKTTFVMLVFLVVSGCAHSHRQGSVVFLDSPEEGHVCLGEGEVSPGDKVNFYKSECVQEIHPTGGKLSSRMQTKCKKVEVGKGYVVNVSDDHFSRVKAEDGTKLATGYIVEKRQ